MNWTIHLLLFVIDDIGVNTYSAMFHEERILDAVNFREVEEHFP